MVKLKDKDATTFLVNQQRFKNYIGKDVDWYRQALELNDELSKFETRCDIKQAIQEEETTHELPVINYLIFFCIFLLF